MGKFFLSIIYLAIPIACVTFFIYVANFSTDTRTVEKGITEKVSQDQEAITANISDHVWGTMESCIAAIGNKVSAVQSMMFQDVTQSDVFWLCWSIVDQYILSMKWWQIGLAVVIGAYLFCYFAMVTASSVGVYISCFMSIWGAWLVWFAFHHSFWGPFFGFAVIEIVVAFSFIAAHDETIPYVPSDPVELTAENYEYWSTRASSYEKGDFLMSDEGQRYMRMQKFLDEEDD
ncbi:hypothetical protein ACFL08_04865 [Patescibacteria group bacterium]